MRGFGLDRLRSAAGRLSELAARTMALEAAAHMQAGSLDVVLPDGQRRRFGTPGAEPHGEVRVHDDAFFARTLAGGEMAVGETYMDGLWSSADLTTVLLLGILNRQHAPAFLRRLSDLPSEAGWALHRDSHGGDGRRPRPAQTEAFFRQVLDETMSFSCPVFAFEGQALRDAQGNKHRIVAEKALLAPGDRVLEAGCGWGAFALYAAGVRGCQVTALTPSVEEEAAVRRRAAEAELSGRVEVAAADGAVAGPGSFDAVVSIESFEAVGETAWDAWFRRCASMLLPGGRMVVQTKAVPAHVFVERRGTPDWMQRYIVPGGALPSPQALTQAAAKAGLVEVESEDVGRHYPPALQEWQRRLRVRREELPRLGYDERFLRMWEFYFSATEAAFLAGVALNLIVVFRRAE